ncbi:MAG: hypothetical protein B6D68_00235 [spirochete symbiont of Stewartia floridana]|nr:MAG: hypothetical protein B6D68_00235 [spirochete symbiont of Stewartia floridana]
MGLLTAEGSRRIARAVEDAEKSTAGEIVVAIIPESDDYAARELVFAIASGFIASVIMVIFSEQLIQLFDSLLWIDSALLFPLSMLAGALLAGSSAYALAQIPVLDRLIAGRHLMTEAVRRRALRHFTESGVYDTVDRTGVLLLVSVLEHRVELIADRGINKMVAANSWENIVAALVKGIKKGQTADAIEKAVRDIGGILAEHVPPRADDVNEIADVPTELEKGS